MYAHKISIIVPIYNAKNDLDDCIKSILVQKMTDWELLLVNDGSTDNSLAICRQYEKQDTRIQVFDLPNQGVSAARNYGLDHAQGDYIVFIDADDFFINDNVFDTMLATCLSTNCDIVVADYARLWKGKLLPTTNSAANLTAWDRESDAFRFRSFYSIGCLSYVWGKLYRRSFLEQNGIRFPPLTYAEDKVFSVHCYFCGARYAFTGITSYCYRMNPNSVSYQYRSNSAQQWICAAQQMECDLKNAGGNPSYEMIIWVCIVFAAFFDSKMEYEKKHHSINSVYKLLRFYGQNPLAQKAFKTIGSYKGIRNIKQKMWQFLLYGFSMAMRLHFYHALSIGIKLLVDLKIDEQLSDTGVRE